MKESGELGTLKLVVGVHDLRFINQEFMTESRPVSYNSVVASS